MTTPSLSTQELMKKASDAYLAGNLKLAYNHLTQIIQQDPSNARAWVWLAEVVADPQQKKQCYEKALQLDPTDIQAEQGLKAFLPPPPPEVKSKLKFRQPNLNQQAPQHSTQPNVSIPEGQLTISWKEKLISGNVPYQQWVEALLLPQDHIAKNQQRRGLGFAVSGIGLVASLIGLFTSNMVVIIIGMLWFIGIVGVTLSKTPLSIIEAKPVTEIIVPFLKMLEEDIDPKKPLELSVDLSDVESHANIHLVHTPDDRHMRYKDTFYAKTWFHGKARMIDGTLIRWEVIDNLRKRRITRRNPRGKVKTKTKRKIKRSVTCQLLLKNTYVPNVQPRTDPVSEVIYDQAKQKLIAQRKLGQAPSNNATVMALITTIGDMYRFLNR